MVICHGRIRKKVALNKSKKLFEKRRGLKGFGYRTDRMYMLHTLACE